MSLPCLDCGLGFDECQCRSGADKAEYFRERSRLSLRLADAVEHGEPFFVRFDGRDLPATGIVDRKADTFLKMTAEFKNVQDSAVSSSIIHLVSAEGELVSLCKLKSEVRLFPGDSLLVDWEFSANGKEVQEISIDRREYVRWKNGR